MKFYDASSVPNDPDIINFWRLLPCEQFPELKKNMLTVISVVLKQIQM